MRRFLALTILMTLTACASRRAVEDVTPPPPTQVKAPVAKPQIKYVYIDRTPPTVSAMTFSPLEAPPAKEFHLWSEIGRILWPLIALLGAGAVMIAGLYVEHLVINRQLAARRARQALQSA